MQASRFWLIGLALMGGMLPTANALETGLVVERIEQGHAGQVGGLLPGDVLLSWTAAAGGMGVFGSPFDLFRVEIEHAPLGSVTIVTERSGDRLYVELPPGEWKIQARPRFTGEILQAYLAAEQQVASGEVDAAVAGIRELVDPATEATDRNVWLLHRAALWLGEADNWPDSESLFDEAAGLAQVHWLPML